MNKFKALIATMLTAVMLPATAFAAPSNALKFKSMNGIVYYAKNVVTENEISAVMAGYNKLPDIVKYKLAANGVRIYVYPKSYETESEKIGNAVSVARSALRGVLITDKGIKSIQVLKPSEVFIYTEVLDKLQDKTTVHEIGHIVDDLYIMNAETDYNASRSDTFVQLSNQYKDIVQNYDDLTKQNSYDIHELYAECFRIMVENPGYLLGNAPELYNYMAATITK